MLTLPQTLLQVFEMVQYKGLERSESFARLVLVPVEVAWKSVGFIWPRGLRRKLGLPSAVSSVFCLPLWNLNALVADQASSDCFMGTWTVASRE